MDLCDYLYLKLVW